MAFTEEYTVRKMTAAEVENVAVAWAAEEGWNPGLHDAPVFYNTDPDGFFVGLLGDEPVACISAVAYNADFGFIGFYIVKPEHRNKGCSIKLLRAAMNHLKTQNIGIDGVLEQQARYKKMGYHMAYNNIRYEGVTKKQNSNSEGIIEANHVDFDTIAAYDTKLFPVPRPRFLKEWMNLPDSKALVSVHNEIVKGYGVIRSCCRGYKIGPLFADSLDIARELLVSLIGSVEPNTPFYLDIPEINHYAVELTAEFQMQKVFETARMYSKSFPEIEMHKIFGITSFELG